MPLLEQHQHYIVLHSSNSIILVSIVGGVEILLGEIAMELYQFDTTFVLFWIWHLVSSRNDQVKIEHPAMVNRLHMSGNLHWGVIYKGYFVLGVEWNHSPKSNSISKIGTDCSILLIPKMTPKQSWFQLLCSGGVYYIYISNPNL